MPPTLADRVRHILEAIQDIERLLAGKSAAAYTKDRYLRLTIERLLEIICEAARHVPSEVKAAEPAIHWERMVDFGSRLRHAYHNVDTDIVWTIVHDRLPPLKVFVERIIRDEQK